MSLTYEQADALFTYDAHTGSIYWKEGRRKGKRASTKSHSGYRVNIKGRQTQVSHIIWLFETKEWPEKDIKYINGDMFDNRFSNMILGARKPTKKPVQHTYEYLSAAIKYDPETGHLYSTHGNRVGYKCKDGYMQVTLPDGSQRKSHRIAWMLMTGSYPNQLIDHIDGDKTNNKWNNLRSVTYSQNGMNSKHRSSNTSGSKGVSFCKQYGKWEAYIWRDNKKHNLGYYDDKSSAAAAYAEASKEMHGEYARA